MLLCVVCQTKSPDKGREKFLSQHDRKKVLFINSICFCDSSREVVCFDLLIEKNLDRISSNQSRFVG